MKGLRPDPVKDRVRVARERHGRHAEYAAAVVLTLHGYRILARRHRTPYGELDLIGVRGKRLAFVEVQLRRSWVEAEIALEAVRHRRMYDAAEHWLQRFPAFSEHELGFDAVIVLPWRWPVLLRDVLGPVGYERP